MMAYIWCRVKQLNAAIWSICASQVKRKDGRLFVVWTSRACVRASWWDPASDTSGSRQPTLQGLRIVHEGQLANNARITSFLHKKGNGNKKRK